MSWMVDDLSKLVDFLSQKGPVYGPVGQEQIVFERIDDGQTMNLSRLSDVSARHLFQPMTHYFLRFEDRPDAEAVFVDYDDSPWIAFGLRPCFIIP